MSPQPDNPLATVIPNSTAEFTPEERRILLNLAHESIRLAFEKLEVTSEPPSEHLAARRGAFTTLYLHGNLRGCVGYVFPIESIYRTIANTARAAAFEDTRFLPVTREEAPLLTVSLSILSPIQAITPEEIEVGKHGLLISQHGRRGLLLPQVASEHGWSRETFLDQTCQKAGLPADSWHRGAIIEAFTAEIFGDEK